MRTCLGTGRRTVSPHMIKRLQEIPWKYISLCACLSVLLVRVCVSVCVWMCELCANFHAWKLSQQQGIFRWPGPVRTCCHGNQYLSYKGKQEASCSTVGMQITGSETNPHTEMTLMTTQQAGIDNLNSTHTHTHTLKGWVTALSGWLCVGDTQIVTHITRVCVPSEAHVRQNEGFDCAWALLCDTIFCEVMGSDGFGF